MQKNFLEGELQQALEFMHDKLKAMKLNARDLNNAELMCEEALLRLMEYCDFRKFKYFSVNVRKSFGDVVIDLTVPGEEFDFTGSIALMNEEISPDADDAIQNIILRLFSSNLKYRHFRNFNSIRIVAIRSNFSSLYKTLGALISAVLIGILIRSFMPENFYMALNDDFLDPIRTIFINGLRMCAVPVVFFSIASCLTQFATFSGFKSIGIRLIIYFVLIQFLASFVGIGLVKFFGTGSSANFIISSSANAESQSTLVYLKSMMFNLMPENFIKPFFDGNMLQLIVLAVLTGIAVGASNAKIISSLFDEFNNVFMKVTEFLLKFVTFIVFFSILSTVITTGINTIFSVIGIFWTVIAAYASMIIIYCLIIFFLARLNPLRFLAKSLPVITTALATCSNNAVMPYAIKTMQNMGVSSRVNSFAIPLGTALNKTAFSAYLGVAVFSVANMYGINLSSPQILSLCFSIVIIALGTPGMPGAGALSVLFAQAGCPVEAIALLMGIEPILDIFDTATTAMSNLTITLTAAKHENMLNIDEYNKL